MKLTDDDKKAFESATRGVRRLKPVDTVSADRPKPKPRAGQSRLADAELLAESIGDHRAGELGEEIGFCRPGVSQRTFKALRRGRFAIEAEIDLHGLTQPAAQAALQAFISESLALGLGCVRVIHGKGMRSGPEGPILKASVQHWLSRWDAVLAYTTAQARHGGTGAVCVLLRQS